MLSAIVHAKAAPEALAITLAALVPGVAEGLVSDAVVVAPATDPGVVMIADAMGATLVLASSEPWHAAARLARSRWLLLLDAGETPEPGWIDGLERHLMHAGARETTPGVLLPVGLWPGLVARARLLLRMTGPDAGWVVPRQAITERGVLTRPVLLPVQRRLPPPAQR